MRIPTHVAIIGLSWEGSEFDQEEAPLSLEQIKVHAHCCKFFRDLKEELADEGQREREGRRQAQQDTPDEALLVSPGESAMPRRFSASDALSLNLALVLFLRVFALDCSNIETSIPAESLLMHLQTQTNNSNASSATF